MSGKLLCNPRQILRPVVSIVVQVFTMQYTMPIVGHAADALASTQVMVGGFMVPTTISLDAVPLPGLKLTIRDTWGTRSAVQRSQMTALFPALLEGCFPSSWKLHDDCNNTLLETGKSTRFRRRAHAVMFFITALSLADGSACNELEHIRHLCLQVCCACIEPLCQCPMGCRYGQLLPNVVVHGPGKWLFKHITC